MEIVFFVLLVLYSVVSAKGDEWITISALGFKTATPQFFLEKPRLYGLCRFVLFLGAAASVFWFTSAPWFIGLVLLGAASLGAALVGRKKAFATYRNTLRMMMEIEDNTPEQRAQYEAQAQKTDQELMDLVRSYMKMGI
jgi:hypothetical protein